MDTIEEQSKCGEYESEDEEDDVKTENIRICLIGELAYDQETYRAALTFNVPIVTSEDGFDLIDDDASWTNYFILNNFDGPIYDAIYKTKQRILGPPALQEAALLKQGIPRTRRPLYNHSMKGVIICFTGIRKKNELRRLVTLIHSMGGSIRKDVNTKVTHLICNSVGNLKYQYGITFRLEIVKSDWVYESWKNRDNISFESTNSEFTKMHTLKPFDGHKICFLGFPEEESEHMSDILKDNGGVVTALEDPECTHVVMAEACGHFPANLPHLYPSSSPILIKDKLIDGNCLDNTSIDCNESCVQLTKTQANKFLNDNISPIFKTDLIDLKRKRDSFDNISTISTDIWDNKKPKLSRTDSIKKSFKRRMSISVAPIAKMIGFRRNTVDAINSFEADENDVNKSLFSNKLRDFRDRLSNGVKCDVTPKSTKFNSKRQNDPAPKLTKNNSDFSSPENGTNKNENDLDNFLTPLAPKPLKCTSINLNSIYDNEYSLHIDDKNAVKKLNSIYENDFVSNAGWNQINKNEDNKDVNCMRNECDISLCSTTNFGNINRVVDEHLTQTNPKPRNAKAHIVKSDWFWYTIQNGYADEKESLFNDYLDSITITPLVGLRESLPISLNKRKRKRGSQALQSEGTPNSSGKRRSSVSDAGGLLSISGSFLDCTVSPDKHDSKIVADQSLKLQPKIKSMRYHYFTDFCYTESNYVGILETIVNLFKNPLEKKSESGDELLNKSEIKSIFGNFTSIYQVHKQMLENLQKIQLNWSEDCLIGEIITEERDKLIKAYPPYVNFFEQMKETLQHCDLVNPRFHAFLKINQAKPECGRQSLQELMIRPVQRLPSISLLLNDILKHTNKTSPDYIKLEEALVSIKEVMTYINEDKRKTDSQLAMFDIFNDIEGCPAQLVSSHRSFITKCEVTELSDTLSGRRGTLLLYLFSDTIEVCKRRSKSGFNSAKSPSAAKTFKHIKLMPLSTIKYVIEISDSQRGFAISCRQNQDMEDKLYSFVILDEEIDRSIYLRTICKQIAENACYTEKPFISMSSQELDVNISDVNLSTLSKAFKFATKTKSKVSRAFSFNKTPSKLKRAVSTIMPSPFGSTNSLTPSSHISSHIANMRLASCTNINEVDEEIDCNNDTKSEILIASTPIKPPRVQPKRTSKSTTIASLRRI